VAVPAAPGVVGTVVANGKTVELHHVYSKRVVDDFAESKSVAVLLFSEHVLDPRSFTDDTWKYSGQGTKFEGIGVQVAENGTIRNLVVHHKDVPYQMSGPRMAGFEWTGDVVKGQHAEAGLVGKLPWSYSFAFNASLPKAGAPKRR
jgi:hypothetical protein